MRAELYGDRGKSVALALPRFTTKFSANLEPAFKQAGIIQAFTDNADFGGMARRPPPGVKIGSIMHRAVIEVTEEGTEAAAATHVVYPTLSMAHWQPPPPEPFQVDRPFLFYVVDDATGVILFQGRIVVPAN